MKNSINFNLVWPRFLVSHLGLNIHCHDMINLLRFKWFVEISSTSFLRYI
jgi:hypothetical protein